VHQEDLYERLYELRAEVCRALSHPTRLKILDLIAEEERSVKAITQSLGLSKSTISQHLKHLRMATIITSRKDGKNVYYRVVNPKAIEACHLLQEVIYDQLTQGSLIAQQIQD
jgi:ArsR family transcriptional regulator